MALPVSTHGNFQIIALSFSPSIISFGETTNVSITLKNTSGKSITRFGMSIDNRYPSTEAQTGYYGWNQTTVYGSDSGDFLTPISWANGVSKTFTFPYIYTRGSLAPDESKYIDTSYKCNLELSIVANIYVNNWNGDVFEDLRGASGEYLTILIKRDAPRLTFNVARTPDDSGIQLLASASLSADNPLTALSNHGYAISMYRSNEHDPATITDTTVPFSATLSQLYAGISNSSTFIPETFSNGDDWSLLIRVTNGYETAMAECSVPRAFSNLHLSGAATGGVAFGKFSSSTLNNPKLESEYPFYAYGGIEGVTNYAESEVDTGGTWIDGKPIYRRVFSGDTTLRGAKGTVANLGLAPETVVGMRGMYKTGAEMWATIPSSFFNGLTWMVTAGVNANGTIDLSVGSSYSGTGHYILVIDYTKTTD